MPPHQECQRWPTRGPGAVRFRLRDRDAAVGLWFASEPAIEIEVAFKPSLGRCVGPVPGGLIDAEWSAPEGPTALAGGEVAGVLGGNFAAAHAGRRGAQVGRGCLDGDQAQAAGQGWVAGGVRGLSPGALGVDRAGRDRGAAGREREALGSDQGTGGGAVAAPGKAALGLFGPVPARVSAETKLELLGLIDAASAAGGAHGRAGAALELADVRAPRWRARLRETGSLQDWPPVGTAVHRILAWEEQAILELIEQWGWVDRSHC